MFVCVKKYKHLKKHHNLLLAIIMLTWDQQFNGTSEIVRVTGPKFLLYLVLPDWHRHGVKKLFSVLAYNGRIYGVPSTWQGWFRRLKQENLWHQQHTNLVTLTVLQVPLRPINNSINIMFYSFMLRCVLGFFRKKKIVKVLCLKKIIKIPCLKTLYLMTTSFLNR